MHPLSALPKIPALKYYFGIRFRFYSMDRKQVFRSSDVLHLVWNRARKFDEKVLRSGDQCRWAGYARINAGF